MRSVLSLLLLVIFSLGVEASTGLVRHVSDGDSFILASGERVRMIGINAPELKDEFGQQAKDHLAKLIRGKTVTLDGDPQNDDRDVHGRLLRFVTLDGIDINRQMIVDGYAYAFLRYQFAREKRDAYREAEGAAKSAGIGIWVGESPAKSIDAPTPRPPLDGDDTSRSETVFSWQTILLALAACLVIFLLFGALFLRRR